MSSRWGHRGLDAYFSQIEALATAFTKCLTCLILCAGDLVKQAVQRFSSYEDLDKQNVTIEEREEYEQHISGGTVVYAGVDYEAILRQVFTFLPFGLSQIVCTFENISPNHNLVRGAN